jgi:hypothetical protein
MLDQPNEQPSHGWKDHNCSERFVVVNKVGQFHGVDAGGDLCTHYPLSLAG